MATFAAAAAIGPLIGGLLVEHASWRWGFYVNLPVGLLALVGLRLRLPAAATQPPKTALDAAGAALLATATTALMLICIWGGQRYAYADSCSQYSPATRRGGRRRCLDHREHNAAGGHPPRGDDRNRTGVDGFADGPGR
jgi:MFS family permease